MPRGTLEVILISAKDLNDTDFFSKIDPYAILTYRSQEKTSTVKKGGDPYWNESFLFTVSDSAAELNVRLMDKDTFTKDDFLGKAKIYLGPVFAELSVPETSDNVVKDQKNCGELRLALNFTPEIPNGPGYGEEENFGGWRESVIE